MVKLHMTEMDQHDFWVQSVGIIYFDYKLHQGSEMVDDFDVSATGVMVKRLSSQMGPFSSESGE